MAREVIIDVTRLVDRALKGRLPTGVDRVCLAYVAHFLSGEETFGPLRAMVRFGGRWVVPSRSASRKLLLTLLEPRPSARLMRWIVAFAYGVRWQPVRDGVLLNLGHSGLDDPDYAQRIRRYGLKALYFLHDLIPITHPEYCRAGEAVKHRTRLATMLDTGLAIIVNSQATKDALARYAANLGTPLPACPVALLAAAPLPDAASVAPLDGPYFVTLGTIEPRKNHLLLLHVWRRLVETLGTAAPRLVIIGQRGWDCEQVVDLLERCDALDGVVIERSGCSDGDLATYLRHARALLFPSFEEGYGMPLAEALGMGVPVVASALPVFREIAGIIPDYVDSLDGLGWQAAILDFAAPNSVSRRQQCERLQSFNPPTWEEHFAVVDRCWRELFASNP